MFDPYALANPTGNSLVNHSIDDDIFCCNDNSAADNPAYNKIKTYPWPGKDDELTKDRPLMLSSLWITFIIMILLMTSLLWHQIHLIMTLSALKQPPQTPSPATITPWMLTTPTTPPRSPLLISIKSTITPPLTIQPTVSYLIWSMQLRKILLTKTRTTLSIPNKPTAAQPTMAPLALTLSASLPIISVILKLH